MASGITGAEIVGNESSINHTKIHFFYVTVILSLFVIGLATNHWTNLQGFPEYLNVAATITSLVLGVLAIIYAFVSTGAMNQFLGSIQSSSTAINEIAGEMRDALVAGQQLQTRADQRSEELQRITKDLAAGLASLDESNKKIAGKVDSTHSQLSSLQDSLLTATPTQLQDSSTGAQQRWTREELSASLKSVSQFGLLTLKGVLLAKEKDLYLDVERLGNAKLYLYGYGYLLALQAAGLIKLGYPKKNKNQVHAVRLLSGPAGIEDAIDAEWVARKGNSKTSKFILEKEPLLEGALHDGAAIQEA